MAKKSSQKKLKRALKAVKSASISAQISAAKSPNSFIAFLKKQAPHLVTHGLLKLVVKNWDKILAVLQEAIPWLLSALTI